MVNLRAALFMLLTAVSGTALAQRTRVSDEPVAPPPEELRPDGFTLGIGAGWAFPQSILEPNTASVRLRFGPALAIEPALSLGGSTGGTSSTGSVTIGGTTVTDEQQDTEGGLNLGLGANVRYSLASAGPVDFVGIGGLGFNYGSNTTRADVQEQDMLDQTTVNQIGVGANWGVGVEWFISRNIVLSADATNPLVSWSQRTTVRQVEDRTGNEPETARTEAVESDLNFGLRIAPTVRLMFHLYF